MMPTFNPVLWRTARLIHDQLRVRRRSHAQLYLPQAIWAKTQQLLRQIDTARARGWDRATTVLRERLLWQLQRLQSEIDRVDEEVNRQKNYSAFPSVHQLADELQDLSEEFEDLQCQPRRGLVSVTTQPIILESIELGRFQIELEIKALATSQYYRVVALEPNPAAENSSVTHPHVQNEHLCEGEGHTAIQVALAEGRLFDFFLIVSRLLSNYGQGSAYIELRDWQGLPCRSCGGSTGDDGCFCQRCDDRICDECTSWCDRCSSSYCSECISACSQCEESYCRSCLEDCADCQEPNCSHCLEQGRCDACRTKQSVESDAAASGETTAIGSSALAATAE